MVIGIHYSLSRVAGCQRFCVWLTILFKSLSLGLNPEINDTYGIVLSAPVFDEMRTLVNQSSGLQSNYCNETRHTEGKINERTLESVPALGAFQKASQR